jgi:hypothetical protein
MLVTFDCKLLKLKVSVKFWSWIKQNLKTRKLFKIMYLEKEKKTTSGVGIYIR